MTFAVLRALHAIVGDAIDDIERIYAQASKSAANGGIAMPTSPGSWQNAQGLGCNASNESGGYYASPPPSPSMATHPPSQLQTSLSAASSHDDLRSATPPPDKPSSIDFPSLDAPYDPNSPAEAYISHPVVTQAISRLVAAAGQLSSTVQVPFLTLGDACMGYHLPSCLRLLEASHIVELLRDYGPAGMHVDTISERTSVEASKLAHALRLLATHHILREVSPNVFANNRLSSVIDTGKSFEQLRNRPEAKYRDTNGSAAFVGLCTDELFKSSAYLTEAYYLSPDARIANADPVRAPFNYAFGCEGTGFFSWLEGEGVEGRKVNGPDRKSGMLPGIPAVKRSAKEDVNPNQYRLERFGKAMSGTDGWEVPGAILNALDWQSLPRGSVVVDVGGGIGSTSMLLASAFSGLEDCSQSEDAAPGLKFVIQDREVVVDMGLQAWRAKCPEFLESGVAAFQSHDFFTRQPIRNAAVFLLRVILHDWPDAYAEKILLRLREAATEDTKLLIAEFVLPLACVDDQVGKSRADGGAGNEWEEEDILDGVQGAEKSLAPAPLLANLGKASANVYWMDMTMQCAFNSRERTLREVAQLCRSTGWKVTRLVKAPGSLFGHITAVPVAIPSPPKPPSDFATLNDSSLDLDVRGFDSQLELFPAVPHTPVPSRTLQELELEDEQRDRANALGVPRSGTPSFGSRMELPSLEERRQARFGFMKGLFGGGGKKAGGLLRQATGAAGKEGSGKKRPPPLAISQPIASEELERRTRRMEHVRRRSSLSQLSFAAIMGNVSGNGKEKEVEGMREEEGEVPPLPTSPRSPGSTPHYQKVSASAGSMRKRASLAQMNILQQGQGQGQDESGVRPLLDDPFMRTAYEDSHLQVPASPGILRRTRARAGSTAHQVKSAAKELLPGFVPSTSSASLPSGNGGAVTSPSTNTSTTSLLSHAQGFRPSEHHASATSLPAIPQQQVTPESPRPHLPRHRSYVQLLASPMSVATSTSASSNNVHSSNNSSPSLTTSPSAARGEGRRKRSESIVGAANAAGRSIMRTFNKLGGGPDGVADRGGAGRTLQFDETNGDARRGRGDTAGSQEKIGGGTLLAAPAWIMEKSESKNGEGGWKTEGHVS